VDARRRRARREDGAARAPVDARAGLVLRALIAAATVVAGLVLVTSAMADLSREERFALLYEGQPLIVNSKAGESIVRGRNLVPGERVRGQVRIKNKGRGAGILYVRLRRPIDTPGPWGGLLSQNLVLTIRRIDRGGSLHTVWKGHLGAMGKVKLAVLRPGAVRRYRFIVQFRVRLPARGYFVANRFARSRFTTAFVWQLVPVE